MIQAQLKKMTIEKFNMGLQSLGALFMLVLTWPFYIYITGIGPVQPGWVLPDAVGSSTA